jgi:hypothetical protein
MNDEFIYSDSCDVAVTTQPALMPLTPPSKTVLGMTYPPYPDLTANISVSYGNEEEFFIQENVAVTIYLVDEGDVETPAMGSMIAHALQPGENRLSTIEIKCYEFNGTPIIPKGFYKVKAEVSGVFGDGNPANDQMTTPTQVLNISIAGDIARLSYTSPRYPITGEPDGKVDIIDLGSVAKRFGEDIGDPTYCPNCDVIYDGKIDIADVSLVSKFFGRVDP